jgi:hypothetical protein
LTYAVAGSPHGSLGCLFDLSGSEIDTALALTPAPAKRSKLTADLTAPHGP